MIPFLAMMTLPRITVVPTNEFFSGNDHAVQSITLAQETELNKIIEERKSIVSSDTSDDGLGMIFNSDGGPTNEQYQPSERTTDQQQCTGHNSEYQFW